MKRILIAKDVAYANNKASAGANSATNPIDLLEGAIGIYGIPKTSTNNKDKFALIIDGGSDAAGKVPDSAYDGDKIWIGVGLSGAQARESLPIDLNGEIEITAAEYAAAAAKLYTVGYYNTAGQVDNLPTAVAGDVIGIKISKDTNEPDMYDFQWEVKLDAAEADYSAMARLADKIAHDANNDIATVKLTGNIAGSAIGNSATCTVVKGSTAVVVAVGDHALDVGDYVKLNGDIYKVTADGGATAFTLDKPYRGASATLANAVCLDLGATAPTEHGLSFTGVTAGEEFFVAAYGNLANATHTLTTPATQGQGSAALVKEIEDMWMGRMGAATKAESAVIPHPASQVVTGATYDIYTIKYKNKSHPAGNNRITDVWNTLVVAFPDAGSNGAQAEFEDIMGTLINGSDGIGGIDAA